MDRAEKCRSVLLSGGRRSSIWRGVLCPAGVPSADSERYSPVRPNAVLYALSVLGPSVRSLSPAHVGNGSSGHTG